MGAAVDEGVGLRSGDADGEGVGELVGFSVATGEGVGDASWARIVIGAPKEFSKIATDAIIVANLLIVLNFIIRTITIKYKISNYQTIFSKIFT